MQDTINGTTLYRFSRALHHLDVAVLMDTIVQQTSAIIQAPNACLATFKPDLTLDAAVALNPETTSDLWTSLLAHGVVGFAYHSRRTIVIRNLATDPRWIQAEGVPQHGSAVTLPLQHQDAPYGALMLLHDDVDYFTDATVALLEELVSVAEVALANALEHAHLRYDGLFRDAAVPMIITDLNGYILDLNHEAMLLLSYELSALIGSPIDVIHSIDATALHVGSLRAMQPNVPITFNTFANTNTGDQIPMIVRAQRRMFNGREVIELVEQNISAQSELERLRRDLTAMIYHDLRNPLHTLDMAVQRLARVLANYDNAAVLTMLQSGVRSVRQLRRMVDSLLDVERLEQGNRMLNRQMVELRNLLSEAVQLVQPLSMEAGQRLRFDVASNIPLLHLDSDMILRVVINLLENAIKYTPEEGSVWLKAEMSKGNNEVRIVVSDSGPGIPKKRLKSIFDKYSRVRHQDAPKGVGLGLAFCRLAIEAHGGEIWVESEIDSGSHFIFTLPVATELVTQEVTVS